jgi:predicted phosphoribosyltransferase
VRELGLTTAEVDQVIVQEEIEMARRATLFRSGRPSPELGEKTVIIVDDGLATGATAVAAIESVRRQKPRAIILAVPVGARETVSMLRPRVDDLVVLTVPWTFRAVGEWYEDFDQVSDQRVIDLLRGAALAHQVPHP